MKPNREWSGALPVRDRAAARVAGLATVASLYSFLYYYRQGALLFYGDAVAHINIARRVFDSLTPGPMQLGTVWLPLPHLLMVPFLWSNAMWQSGVGGSIPSMIAYVAGVAGVFRLTRVLLSNCCSGEAALAGAWAAALSYGLNPNLLYMQSTAMTECIYLALFVWAVTFFVEFHQSCATAGADGNKTVLRSLTPCALCLAGSELTRYDGWILAAVIGAAALILAIRRWEDRVVRRTVMRFALAVAAVPILWLTYNRAVYGNAFEFANGPYSARAIEQRVEAPNPALHSAPVAALYFMKSAQLNVAPGNWGRFWLAAALAALGFAFWKLRGASRWIALLWVPLPFYAWSIAYGSVPLHVQTWWPYAVFNQRYGLQLLPMLSISAGVVVAGLPLPGRKFGRGLVAWMFLLILASDLAVWSAGPACYQEARRNWNGRSAINSATQKFVESLPPKSTFLMDLGEHVGIFEQAGIPLRRVVNNENDRPWKRPEDPDGLWTRALADPARLVDYVIVFDGDEVDRKVNRSGMALLAEIHGNGQRARIYETRRDAKRH